MAEGVQGRAPPAPAACDADLGAAITALRARGAQHVDPVRFAFIEALARRAAAHQGEVRQLLDAKLASAVSACEERFGESCKTSPSPAGGSGCGSAMPGPVEPPRGQGGPLADLVQRLAGQVGRAGLADTGHAGEIGHTGDTGGSAGRGGLAEAASGTELKTLRHFRGTWAQLSVALRLTQSLSKMPENTGPLNSEALALRALQAMRDISPHYLRRFMSYVDALLWLDQASGAAAPVQQDVVRGGEGHKPRKAARKKTA